MNSATRRMRGQWEACKAGQGPASSGVIKAHQGSPSRRTGSSRRKNARHIHLIGKDRGRPRDRPQVDSPAGLLRRGSVEGIDRRGRIRRTWIVEFTAAARALRADPHEDDGSHQAARLVPARPRASTTARAAGQRAPPRHERRRRKRAPPRLPIPTSACTGSMRAAKDPPPSRRPTKTAGASGQHYWRAKAFAFKQGRVRRAALRSGVASGSRAATAIPIRTSRARDILAIVASLRTGEGLRAMNPAGENAQGARAGGRKACAGGPSSEGLATIPLRQTRAAPWPTGWAMTKNFDQGLHARPAPRSPAGPPLGDRTIKAAILFRRCSPAARAT